MPLIIRPGIEPDEGFRAYVCRLATRNRAPSLFRPMLDSMFKVAAAAPEFACLSGEGLETLRRRGCAVRGAGREPGGVCFGDAVLPRKLVRVRSRAVCPQCIAKNGVSLCVWELHGYNVCHRHGLKLVDACSACKQPLSWEHPSSDQCACGFPLAKLEAKTGRSGRRRLCRILAKSMLRSIHGGPVTGDLDSAAAAPIDWTLVLCEFISGVLIPRFGERHGLGDSKPFLAARDALTASMLEDRTYRDYLRDVVFMYASADPMTLVSTLRPGRLDEWALCRYEGCWGELCFHQSLWDLKRTAQERRTRSTPRGAVCETVRPWLREGSKRMDSAQRAVPELIRLLGKLEKPVALAGSP